MEGRKKVKYWAKYELKLVFNETEFGSFDDCHANPPRVVPLHATLPLFEVCEISVYLNQYTIIVLMPCCCCPRWYQLKELKVACALRMLCQWNGPLLTCFEDSHSSVNNLQCKQKRGYKTNKLLHLLFFHEG